MHSYKVANWREVIRRNHRKTKLVLFTFVLLYILIGLLTEYLLWYETLDLSFYEMLESFAYFKHIPKVTIFLMIAAIIFVYFSFIYHDKIMLVGLKTHEVNEWNTNLVERKLYNIIQELKIAAGLSYLPKIYIIDADYMNAFASGYSEKSAMVAITRGLLEKLDRDELQAVMAHELSHIRHLDIKLTLAITILSNMMLLIVDCLYDIIVRSSRRGRSRGKKAGVIILVIIILRFLLPIITWILFLYLSRAREYMADAGSCQLTRTNEPLARALIKIHHDYRSQKKTYKKKYAFTPNEEARRNAYFYDPVRDGKHFEFSADSLFSTHPKLKNRLKALGFDEMPEE